MIPSSVTPRPKPPYGSGINHAQPGLLGDLLPELVRHPLGMISQPANRFHGNLGLTESGDTLTKNLLFLAQFQVHLFLFGVPAVGC